MNLHLSGNMFALILLCILVEAASQLCFKHAAEEESILRTLRKPMLWLGIALWLVELVVWTVVLEHVPLSIAFPMMSLTYLATLLGGALMYHETITRRHLLGAFCITFGVACVGIGGV